jgi:hypothetical protein
MHHQWSSVAAPVPDEAALHVRMLPEERPVVRKPAVRIAHGMRVLAQEQRPVVIPHSVDQMGAVLGARVHGRDHLGLTQRHSAGLRREIRTIRGHQRAMPRPSEAHHLGGAVVAVAQPFVVRGTRRVARVDPLPHEQMGGSDATLIPQRPHEDARVVLLRLDHTCDASQQGTPPLWRRVQMELIRGGGQGDEAVRLDVGLVHDVQTHLITNLVPDEGRNQRY